MPESEAVMTGKGCEQITSEGYLGEDRSQALRYRDCCSDEILGIGLRWVIWVLVTGIQVLLVLDLPARVYSWELGGSACCSS